MNAKSDGPALQVPVGLRSITKVVDGRDQAIFRRFCGLARQ